MGGSSAVNEIADLLGRADHTDANKAVIADLCAIIADGQKSSYLFSSDQDGGYVAYYVDKKGKEEPVGIVFPDRTSILLLKSANLLETGYVEKCGKGYIVMRPTQKARVLYERLKAEGQIDKHGRAVWYEIKFNDALWKNKLKSPK
jgi:hypothetical protein